MGHLSKKFASQKTHQKKPMNDAENELSNPFVSTCERMQERPSNINRLMQQGSINSGHLTIWGSFNAIAKKLSSTQNGRLASCQRPLSKQLPGHEKIRRPIDEPPFLDR
jgi:hypothetical protein